MGLVRQPLRIADGNEAFYIQFISKFMALIGINLLKFSAEIQENFFT
ncbi:hypothetical protein [Okeania sp. KiyG1]|nr:hypothetical protein [Okeania sp. KiyG1]